MKSARTPCYTISMRKRNYIPQARHLPIRVRGRRSKWTQLFLPPACRLWDRCILNVLLNYDHSDLKENPFSWAFDCPWCLFNSSLIMKCASVAVLADTCIFDACYHWPLYLLCILKNFVFTDFPERHMGLAEMCLPQIGLKGKWIHVAFFSEICDPDTGGICLEVNCFTIRSKPAPDQLLHLTPWQLLHFRIWFCLCSSCSVLLSSSCVLVFSSCVLCPVLQSRRK